jgi:hypothetical protein
MIEYSIGDLKYYYSKYGTGDGDGGSGSGDADTEYTKNDMENISHLEDTLSNAIDNDYINNNIYHIFPNAIAAIAAIAAVAIAAMAATM